MLGRSRSGAGNRLFGWQLREIALVGLSLLGPGCDRTVPSGRGDAVAQTPTPPAAARIGGMGTVNPVVEKVGIDSEPPEGLGTLSGSLSADTHATAQATVVVDDNARIYGSVLLQGALGKYAIVDSEGRLVTLVNLQSNTIASDSIAQLFTLEAPSQGPLTIQLTAGSSVAHCDFVFHFGNGRRLLPTATPFEASPGAEVSLLARIVDRDGNILREGSATFTGKVHAPNETIVIVPMVDDGLHEDGEAADGVFGGTYAGTEQQGRYHVLVEGRRALGTEDVLRSEAVDFIVAAAGATFVGGITETAQDTDRNSRYEVLRFEQDIRFADNGLFMLIADLVDADGKIISTLRWMWANNEGPTSKTAELSVDGPTLRQHGQDGPWRLTNVRLDREDAGALVVARSKDFVTRAYAAADFEPPAKPRIGRLVPNSGPREGGYEVILQGMNLWDTTDVLIGGQVAEFVRRDDSTLVLTVPKLKKVSSRPPEGLVIVDVTVTTRWGSATEEEGFTYDP